MFSLKNMIGISKKKRDIVSAVAERKLPAPVKLHMSADSNMTVSVEMDDSQRPYVSFVVQQHGNVTSSSAVYVNNAALGALGALFASAAQIEYPDVYLHCAAPLPEEGDEGVGVAHPCATRLVFDEHLQDAAPNA